MSKAKNQGKHSKPTIVNAQTISPLWILKMLGFVFAGAALCTWGVFGLIFWQGSWQLLYHPSNTMTQTPAAAGMRFDKIPFATNAAGEPELRGWWIEAEQTAPVSRSQWTVLYLHGANGNLSETVDTLKRLHELGVNVFAYDPRGYGESKFERPTETRELEDAESAIRYLVGTRHVSATKIILLGAGLGADVFLKFAATHKELGGVIVDGPMRDATGVIFSDARARMVPAHWLVKDRYDLSAAAGGVQIPVLWIERDANASGVDFGQVQAKKMRAWLKPSDDTGSLIARWLDEQ